MRGKAAALAVVLLVAAAVGSAAAKRSVQPCRASQLRAHLFLQGATGSLAGGVYVRNVSRRSCSLLGLPHARLVGGGARHERWRLHSIKPTGSEGIPRPPLSSLRTFRHGERALVTIIWSNWCGPGSTDEGRAGRPPAALVLLLPRGGGTFRWRLRSSPRCDRSSRPSYLGISRFAPA